MPASSQPPPVRVDPATLRRCGRQLRQVADWVAGDVSIHWTRLASLPHGRDGWQVDAAADRAAREWSESLLGLVDRLDVLGQAFVAAADSYAGTDSRAAGRTGEARVR